MKKNKFILLLCALLSLSVATAQTPKSINLEIFGTSDFAGVSFDSRMSPDSKYGFKVGLGGGFELYQNKKIYFYKKSALGFMRGTNVDFVVSMPVSAYRLFGREKHFFELGAGLVPYYGAFKDVDLVNYYLTGNVQYHKYKAFNYYGFIDTAYRYEGERLLLSVGLTAPIQTPGSKFTQFMTFTPKLTLGYRF